jgi:hypothetical protein
MTEPVVTLSELALDLPAPAAGSWPAELAARGVELLTDDLGRLAISRDVARHLLAEHRQQLEAAAHHQAEVEAQWIAADEARRASIPKGVPVGQVPTGVSAVEMLVASDPPDRGKRRVSLLEDALARRDEAP